MTKGHAKMSSQDKNVLTAVILKQNTHTHMRAAASFTIQRPLDFEFTTVVSMHRHAACLIRAAHIMSALSVSPSVTGKQGRS